MVVVTGLALVDDDVGRAALGRNQWNRGRGQDRQRRSKREDEIGFCRGGRGAIEVCRAKRLAEADRRRFEQSTARAPWRLPGGFEALEVRHGIARRIALQTLDDAIGPVQLDEQAGRRPRLQVQAVDVLGHDGHEFSRGLELHQGVVRRVRPRAGVNRPRLQLVIPVLDTRCLGCQELVEEHRPAARPDAVGAAKVGDAAGGRYAGAGEHQDSLCGAKVAGKTHCEMVP